MRSTHVHTEMIFERTRARKHKYVQLARLGRLFPNFIQKNIEFPLNKEEKNIGSKKKISRRKGDGKRKNPKNSHL